MIDCPICGKSYEKRASLQRHVDHDHPVDIAPDPEPTEADMEELADRIEEGMGYGEEPKVRPPSAVEHRQIRELIRTRFLTHEAAYEQVMGYPMPPQPPDPAVQSRKLEQVRFRARNAWASQQDTRFLLTLADIGAKAIDRIDPADPLVAEWVQALL
jgi:hypothetical protein